jgi:eukaryotic-like serine/threonine-protein kinase
MRPGQLLAGRFEIQHHVATGGMSRLYCARDRQSGDLVAVKVLQACDPHDAARFRREARILREIRSPGIVRYVAHELEEDGAPYLVMEWLTGEDLHTRLVRAELSIPESVLVARRVAEALASVHAHGIVHRDIKPQNLFLVDKRLDAVMLLDFGIARARNPSLPVTGLGAAVGTPGFMAPEQARGEADLDARADVFSLGCVLFRCLTGRPPFTGDHAIAVLAKVIIEDAPRVSEFCPGVPEALEALVTRMLAKPRAGRPEGGAAIARELAALSPLDLDLPARSAVDSPSSSLTGGEQRLVSVLLVGASSQGPPSPIVETIAVAATTSSGASDEAVDGALHEALGAAAVDFDRLADGSRIAVLSGHGAATDQAVTAVRCALAVHAALPEVPVALATGRGLVRGRWPVGQVIDGAAALLRLAWCGGAGAGVRVDALTAGLLGGRFEVREAHGEIVITGERGDDAIWRSDAVRAAACVGRERELRTLYDLFDACVSEPTPTAVLMTASAGVGKSRLAREFVERIRAREVPFAGWVGHGHEARAGAPFAALGAIVRGAAQIEEGEPGPARREKLLAYLASRLDEANRGRIAALLGPLVEARGREAGGAEEAAPRRDDPKAADEVRRAFVDLLAAESEARPVVLLLDDLQWIDAPTVECVDMALRLLEERPLFVLGLARPAVRERFPHLFRERRVTHLRLGELSRKACDRLCRDALGDDVPSALLEQLWERSSGNAFFLEELLRAAVGGQGDAVPSTVLAMIQSRIEATSMEERRVLRAASVFGGSFCRGGVAALLGLSARPAALDGPLGSLERAEWIAESAAPDHAGQREYVFRQTLVRDAAYAMLTDEDRALGHALAAAWLEGVGEPDATRLADHFVQAGEHARAAVLYALATEQAVAAGDLGGAIERSARAVELGVTGEALGALARARSEAHRLRGEHIEAEHWARCARQSGA